MTDDADTNVNKQVTAGTVGENLTQAVPETFSVEIEVHDFIARIEPEPDNDRPGYMKAFDEIVTGPVDMVHIERMSDDTYWMAIYKNGNSQRITFSSANGRAKIVARTEAD